MLIRTALVCSIVSVAAAGSGPTQWPLSEGGNGHWYEVVVVPEGVRWDEAKNRALADGGYLATLTSFEEIGFVNQLVRNTPGVFASPGDTPWIGLFQRPGAVEPAGGWEWVTGEPYLLTAWAPGEPNNLYGFLGSHYGQIIDLGGGFLGWDDRSLCDPSDPENTASRSIAYVAEFPSLSPPAETTFVIPATEDTQILEKSPDENFGSLSKIRLTVFNSSAEGGGDGRARGLMRFDLPASLRDENITAATLELIQTDGITYPGNMVIAPVTANWSESSVTWSTQPAVEPVVERSRPGDRQLLQFDGIDLLLLVRGWIADPTTNHGVQIRFEDEFFDGPQSATLGDTLRTREDPEFGPPVLVLTTGCAADLAQPFGVLDIDDVFVFLGAFVVRQPTADLNNDGLWDIDDVLAFLQVFANGCGL